MLQPNRLISRPFGRRNTVNSRLVRRRPSRYTASYSLRRTRRASRGKSSRGGSDAREAVASLLAASCKDFPSTLSFHAFAKSVLLMTAPHMRLKSAFRQRSSPESPHGAIHPENRESWFEGFVPRYKSSGVRVTGNRTVSAWRTSVRHTQFRFAHKNESRLQSKRLV